MRFEHRFRVRASQEQVAAFHATPRSLKAITLTPMTIHRAPDVFTDGDEIEFTLWLGPVPVRWHGAVEDISVEGFTDTQVAGPFRSWRHRHTFVRVSSAETEVHDVVEAHLRPHIVWGPAALLIWIGLPALFAFRGWRTRRRLEAHAA
jgi:ligand-binding SRPBCC domain-containing protein